MYDGTPFIGNISFIHQSNFMYLVYIIVPILQMKKLRLQY